jgi:hypothetical protein
MTLKEVVVAYFEVLSHSLPGGTVEEPPTWPRVLMHPYSSLETKLNIPTELFAFMFFEVPSSISVNRTVIINELFSFSKRFRKAVTKIDC